jgi:hypothetical protein
MAKTLTITPAEWKKRKLDRVVRQARRITKDERAQCRNPSTLRKWTIELYSKEGRKLGEYSYRTSRPIAARIAQGMVGTIKRHQIVCKAVLDGPR